MAKFYGQVEGQANTIASRRGSSYIKSSVQSWNGSITTELFYNDKEELCIEVMHTDGSGFGGYTVFRGTVENFLEKLKS